MQGIATWAQILFLAGTIGGAVVFGFLMAWRIQIVRSADRHDMRQGFEQQVALLQDTIEADRRSIESRLSAIELSDAKTVVILSHMEQFQSEVRKEFEQVREERSNSMKHLHSRLDTVLNLLVEAKDRDGRN